MSPIRLNSSEILTPARNHSEEYKSIISVFEKVISKYLNEIDGSLFGRIKKGFSATKNSDPSSVNDSYTINLLCVDMLQAYSENASLVNYLYDLTVNFNNLETRLTKRMILCSAMGDLVDIDFSKNLLERYIKNTKFDLLIRYCAIENLREFYCRDDTPDEPEDLLDQVLKMVSDAPPAFKDDVTSDLFDQGIS